MMKGDGAAALGALIGSFGRAPIVAIAGNNFSHRSYLLRSLTAAEGTGAQRLIGHCASRIYVGPEIYNSISGLASSMRGELEIHHSGAATPEWLHPYLSMVGLDAFLDRSPFSLSGGEQACLVIVTALLLRPDVLALDCALEQLSSGLRRELLTFLRNSGAMLGSLVIADNRDEELSGLVNCIDVRDYVADATVNAENLPIGPLIPDPLDSLPKVDAGELAIDNVDFGYRNGPVVLKGASVALAPGHAYVLTGSNGSGKSTLAKVLVGILRPVRGSLFLRGSIFKPWLSPGRVVGYHFQNPDLQLFEVTVEEEVQASSAVPLRRMMGKLVLDAFGLGNLRQMHPLGLAFPFVLRKRVALAATLSMGTDWLILDEPSLGQDKPSTHAIAAIVQRLVRSGRGVIVITHSSHLVEILNAQRLLLRNGKISIEMK